MRKEFREFITKGNLLQLAVAFIMGAAFGSVVHSFVQDIIMPVIGRLVGNTDFSNLFVNLSGEAYETATAAREAGAAAIYYGSFVNALVSFLVVALVMFYLIRVSVRLQKPAEHAAPTTKACPFCATSIPRSAQRCPNCTSQLESS
jgi:large conductance mechanosensitive channel